MMSKPEIFTAYANKVYLGHIENGPTVLGVEAAAQEYFGSSLYDITLAQVATLAAMLDQPETYLRAARNDHYEALLARRDRVLSLMQHNFPERYSAEMIAQTKAEPLKFVFASCGFAQAGITPSLILRSRPGMVRRALAEIIDRLMPLPFLAYRFPLWVLVVIAYHLICDGLLSGQSVGKWVCRLCVVSTTTGEPCGVGRAVLRRLPTAFGQAAYCAWMMIPVVLAYELVSLALVWLNPPGRRIEDYLAGTQVITRSAYLRVHRRCALCGERMAAGASYCSQCGRTVETQERGD
jgi:uncharacterized RDD family membrane protein YckC